MIIPSSVLRLHVELEWWMYDQEEAEIMRKYGHLTREETVTRDILIPSSMPLWALHLALQRSLGFTHSHLYSFDCDLGCLGTGRHGPIDEETYLRNLESEKNGEWTPSFPGGSFKRWIREEITGPYPQDQAPKVRDYLPLKYVYDFGDSWTFTITRMTDCNDLIEAGVRTEDEIVEAIHKVREEKHPVQIAHDGDMLIEDAGNMTGYLRFLRHAGPYAPEVIREKNDWIEPEEMGYDYKDAYDQPEYDHKDEEYLELEERDFDEEDEDENGFTPYELLEWAYSQGWHRGDYTDFDLL